MKVNQKSGIAKECFLARTIFETDTLKQVPTRDGFGEGLVQAAEKNKNIVALCADLTESTRILPFKERFPDRFIQVGIAEQAMASIAAGMSLVGKVPFIASYACFSPGRNWEQIRTCVCLQNSNVKIIGAHAGVSVGPDGATHQMIEDIALTRVLPNMIVIVPCDAMEAKKATLTIAKFKGPAYLRLGREKSPVFTSEKTPFKIGRAEILRHGNDLTLIGAGPLLYEVLLAAETLKKEGIEARVINCHTIKPLDTKTIITAAKETGAVVTIEEAQIAGGLGGLICETLASTIPIPVERIGMQDRFGESGEPKELLEAFGLTAPFIVMAAHRVLQRKKGERVSVIPEYITTSKERLMEMQKNIMEKALKSAPKKWKK